MSFSIEKLPGEPIIISTMARDFNPHQNGEAFWNALAAAMEGEASPIYRITVLDGIEANFSDMMITLAEEARGDRPGSTADPRIRALLVARIPMAQLAVEGLKQDQYGQLDVSLFTTLDEALDYARAEIKK